jgi:hypothetical protein
MQVYAGIDEAGYGPIFGPLTVSRCIFALDGLEPGGEPPPLWRTMSPVLCRKPVDGRKRIAVADSKSLYTPAVGLSRLERGILAFVSATGAKPGTIEELLSMLAYDDLSRGSDRPWYDGADGSPLLPVDADSADLSRCGARLARFRERRNVRLEDMKVAVVFEDRFNRLVRQTGSKAGCLWEFVAGHLRAIWDEFAASRPFVAVDRLGGRTDYRGLLATSLPWADVVALETGAARSVYRLSDGELGMDVLFSVKGEKDHLPVALASMLSKYVRELFMLRFRSFWNSTAPDIKPTYGYQPDGSRFMDEIAPLADRMGIERDTFVRVC